ncbi:MAG: sugar transferase [Planctomycetota bacterium]|jgi:lipopolysaccharide/colanic/teichoic acid biosynthesis glycosyltransferase
MKELLKRLFDKIFILPVMIILLPIFVVINVAIRFSSRGSAIFKQERAGKNGKLLTF